MILNARTPAGLYSRGPGKHVFSDLRLALFDHLIF